MFITRGRIRTILIYVILIGVFLTTVSGIIGIAIPNDRTAAIFAFFMLLLALITVPPIEEVVEEVLVPRPTGVDAVRERLQTYWVEQFLYSEIRDVAELSDKTHLREYVMRVNSHPPKNLELQQSPPHFPLTIPLHISKAGRYDYPRETSKDIKEIYEHLIHAMQLPTNSTNRATVWRDCMVIGGERGSGRTTKLLELATYLLNERATTRVPIYLNLFSWQSDSRSFEKWLVDELIRRYELPSWEARRLVRTNYLVLLLDDFEDVHYKHRRQLLEAISRFLRYRQAGLFPEDNSKHPRETGTLRDGVIICTEFISEKRRDELAKHPCNWQCDNSYSSKKYDDGTGHNKVSAYRVYSDWRRDWYLDMHNRELIEKLKAACVVHLKPISRQQLEDYISQLNENVKNMTHFAWTNRPFLERLRTPYFLNIAGETYKDFQAFSSKSTAGWHRLPNSRLPLPSDVNEWEVRIERDYAKHIIWRLSSEPGSFSRDPFSDIAADIRPEVHREEVIEWLARTMKRQNNVVVRRRDALFYLEDRLFRKLRPQPGAPSTPENTGTPLPDAYKHQFEGFVATITSLLFLSVYLVFAFFLPREALSLPIGLTCGVLILLYGRNFGWHSCEPPHFTLSYDSYVGLNWRSALIAGAFMSVVVSLLFFNISCALYLPRDGVCLGYESTVYGIFSFMLFVILGGLEIGRRNEVLTQPNELIRHVAIVFLFSLVAWVLFFFLFILWPRTLVQNTEDIRSLALDGFGYALYFGVFLSIISSLTLVHSLLRYGLMLWFLGLKINYRVRFTQYLEQFVSIGLMRKIDHGYVFRSRRLLEYFAEDDFNRDEH